MRRLIERLISRIGIFHEEPIIATSQAYEKVKRLLLERLDLRLVVESEICVPIYLMSEPYFPIVKFVLLDKYNIYTYLVESILDRRLYYFPSKVETSCGSNTVLGYGGQIVSLSLPRRNTELYKLKHVHQILENYRLVTDIKYYNIEELSRLVDPYLPVAYLFTIGPYYTLLRTISEVSRNIRTMLLTLMFRCSTYAVYYKYYRAVIYDQPNIACLPYLIPPYQPVRLEMLALCDRDVILFSPVTDGNYHSLTLIPDRLINRRYSHLLTTFSNYDTIYRIISNIERERSKYEDNIELVAKLEEAYRTARRDNVPVQLSSMVSASPMIYKIDESNIKSQLNTIYSRLYLLLKSMSELFNKS